MKFDWFAVNRYMWRLIIPISKLLKYKFDFFFDECSIFIMPESINVCGLNMISKIVSSAVSDHMGVSWENIHKIET